MVRGGPPGPTRNSCCRRRLPYTKASFPPGPQSMPPGRFTVERDTNRRVRRPFVSDMVTMAFTPIRITARRDEGEDLTPRSDVRAERVGASEPRDGLEPTVAEQLDAVAEEAVGVRGDQQVPGSRHVGDPGALGELAQADRWAEPDLVELGVAGVLAGRRVDHPGAASGDPRSAEASGFVPGTGGGQGGPGARRGEEDGRERDPARDLSATPRRPPLRGPRSPCGRSGTPRARGPSPPRSRGYRTRTTPSRRSPTRRTRRSWASRP
ncbi:MAG: hypothetical protein KatS3mg013_1184 [Actinomycetota bacterium]|nr:MAG: hypothetical protein KatS3mg013_1184 [Actinomycetota bacterium]